LQLQQDPPFRFFEGMENLEVPIVAQDLVHAGRMTLYRCLDYEGSLCFHREWIDTVRELKKVLCIEFQMFDSLEIRYFTKRRVKVRVDAQLPGVVRDVLESCSRTEFHDHQAKLFIDREFGPLVSFWNGDSSGNVSPSEDAVLRHKTPPVEDDYL
jgi:hypothetical protein